MTHVFLPHEGAFWLCLADGPNVTPLAQAPGEMTARRKFSDNGAEFAFLDQSGKRLGYYRLLEQAPWFECLMPPVTLPKYCVASDFVIKEGQLIAGGHGNTSESIWVRRPITDKFWRAVPLPAGIGNRGKSIDALFIREDKLIAIDNRVFPKWILLYSLHQDLSDDGIEMVKLKWHNSYEDVKHAAEGANVYALLSTGWNHGTASFYISLLCKRSLNEVVLWSGFIEKTTEQLFDEVRFYDLDEFLEAGLDFPHDWEKPLQEQIKEVEKLKSNIEKRVKTNIGEMLSFINDMAFCGDVLVLALGTHGLRGNNTVLARPAAENSKFKPNLVFSPIALKTITDVTRIECCQSNSAGLYAVGKNAQDEWAYEWVGVERLV